MYVFTYKHKNRQNKRPLTATAIVLTSIAGSGSEGPVNKGNNRTKERGS